MAKPDLLLFTSVVVLVGLVCLWVGFQHGYEYGVEGCAQAIENAVIECNANVGGNAVNTATYCAAKLFECHRVLEDECNYIMIVR